MCAAVVIEYNEYNNDESGFKMDLSIYDIAKLAKVSPATVSRVLNSPNIVKETTRVRVLQVIEQTGYCPNAMAQRLANNRTGLVGLSLQSSSEQPPTARYSLFGSKYLLEFYRGVDFILQNSAYDVVVINGHGAARNELRYHSYIRQKKIDGLIIPLVFKGDPMLQEMIDTGFPFVYTGKKFHPQTFNIYASLHTYLRNIIGRFVSMGHTRIGFISLQEQNRLSEEFPDITLYMNSCTYQDTDELASILRQMIRDGITACFVEDITAIASVYQIAQEMGLHIPRDLSLVSVEHELGLGGGSLHPVDAVCVPAFDIGVSCAQLLLQRLSGEVEQPVEILFEPQLIQRGTTAAR